MSIKTLLNRVREKTGSSSFSESKLGNISGYISTGSYALNRIISGSCFKGIPNGRVLLLAGKSQVGKSYIAAELVSNAIKLNKFDHIFWFDSEGGQLKQSFEKRGIDINNIEHVPVEFIEDATIKLFTIYNEIKKEKQENPNFKSLIIFDSIGALVPSKLLTDATDKGKQVSDMGSSARLKNNLVKGCIMQALITDVPILFILHTYDDPSNMFQSKIQNMSGGQGLQYASTITIQCDKIVQKNEDRDKAKTDIFYNGSYLKFFITKNRMIKPFYETEFFIDFNKGYNKYDGLVEPAMKYGYIVESKKGYYKIPTWKDEDIKKDKIYDEKYSEAWETFIKEFDVKSEKDMQYSSLAELEKQNENFENDRSETEEN